jgi:hypothetical protein
MSNQDKTLLLKIIGADPRHKGPPPGGSTRYQGNKQSPETRQVGLSIFGFDIRGRTPEARRLRQGRARPTPRPNKAGALAHDGLRGP